MNFGNNSNCKSAMNSFINCFQKNAHEKWQVEARMVIISASWYNCLSLVLLRWKGDPSVCQIDFSIAVGSPACAPHSPSAVPEMESRLFFSSFWLNVMKKFAW